MSLYREQYERMMRWYVRFEAIDKGREHDVPSDYYLDEVYAFFMNCYHLKDWLKHDGTVPTAAQQGVEAYINTNRPLQLCADICNSLKHLTLTSSRSGENPLFGKKHFSLELGVATSPKLSLKYEIQTANGPEDAFKLASECVTAWDTFLANHGL